MNCLPRRDLRVRRNNASDDEEPVKCNGYSRTPALRRIAIIGHHWVNAD